MKPRCLTLAVTGLNNTDNPGPGIPFIRGVKDSKEFNTRVIGLAYESLEPGIYMTDLVDKVYQIPYPTAGTEALLQRLEYIQAIEQIDVLVPNFDAELYSFMKLAGSLEKLGIRTFLPTYEQFESRHKSNLPEFGNRYQVKVPRSKEVFLSSEIDRALKGFDFPVVVKGKFYDAYIAYNAEQVGNHFNRISAKWGLPIILQEYIRGTEVNVVALGDGFGNTVGAVPMRKLYITDKGKAWSGITLQESRMMELTYHIIRETKWRGGMELELIKTNAGDLYVIEINPRIPAWVYLAVGAGQNLPEALVKLALDLPVVPFQTYEVGKLFIRYSYDLICSLQDFEKLSTFGEL